MADQYQQRAAEFVRDHTDREVATTMAHLIAAADVAADLISRYEGGLAALDAWIDYYNTAPDLERNGQHIARMLEHVRTGKKP